MNILLFVYTDGSAPSTSRRGRPRKETGSSLKKRRQNPSGSLVDEGLLMDIAADPEALAEAGNILKQKLARQKRKPRRLTEDAPRQNLLPRSGLVRQIADYFSLSRLQLSVV